MAPPKGFTWVTDLTPEQELRRLVNIHTGHPKDTTIIPVAFIGPVLRKALDRKNREMQDDDGAVGICAERAAMSLSTPEQPVRPEAMLRRIYDITHEKSTCASSRFADAFLLALDVHYEQDTDLPELPAGLPAAMEMVDCYFESNPDEEPDPETRRELARLMARFTTGFVNADRVMDELDRQEQELREAVAA